MHLTSNVRGRGAPGIRPADVVRATFPAGTLSGAPKIRAMEIIEELETTRRGIYGGAVGYVSYSGNMDLAIAIRTLVAKQRHHLRAGGRGHRRRQRAGAGAQGVRQQGARGRQRDRGRAASLRSGGQWGEERPDAAGDRQLRLVHLQPRPVPGRAGAGRARRAQRRHRGRGRRRAGAVAHRHLARAVHAQRGGHQPGRHQDVRGQDPDPGRLPGPPVDRPGVRRRRSCAPRASCTARRRRSTTTARACSRGCRTRSRRPATTRW